MSSSPLRFGAEPAIPDLDVCVRICPRHNLVLEETQKGELVCPGPRRHVVHRWKVVNRRTSRAVYQANHEGTEEIMNDKTEISDKPKSKSKTIDRKKFEDASGLVLFLRIVSEPKRYGGDPFRIRWQQGKKGEKGAVAGVSKTAPDEATARRDFAAAVRHTVAQGWKEVAMTFRTLTLKPIPAPRKRAS